MRPPDAGRREHDVSNRQVQMAVPAWWPPKGGDLLRMAIDSDEGTDPRHPG